MPSCSRDVAHESRSAEAEALAWAHVHGGGGGREGRHAEGTREAEEAARASRTGRGGAWHHLQRVHDRLGVRSSAMTKATTQPAVRAEGRSPRRARSPPAWRSETSLRRKGVRGGGSRRACGARASGVEDRDEPAAQKASGVEDRDEPAARQCACGKRERRVQAEPLSAAAEAVRLYA